MTQAPTVATRAAQVRSSIATELDQMAAARAALAIGETPLIADIDRRIAALCQAAESLPRHEARDLAPDFERLQAALDELAASLWSAVRRSKGSRIFPFQLGRP